MGERGEIFKEGGGETSLVVEGRKRKKKRGVEIIFYDGDSLGISKKKLNVYVFSNLRKCILFCQNVCVFRKSLVLE